MNDLQYPVSWDIAPLGENMSIRNHLSTEEWLRMAEHVVAVHRDASKTAQGIGGSEDLIAYLTMQAEAWAEENGYPEALEVLKAHGIAVDDARWIQDQRGSHHDEG
jgi:hypothetical protein